MDLKSKKILIAGAGISGIGAAALLGKAGIPAAIYDGNEALDQKAVVAKLPEGMEVSFELGEFKEELADKYDMLILSPGISIHQPVAQAFYVKNKPVWGEIELASHFAKGKIAAITGTNGKTTTTALVGSILREYYQSVFVVGNIGIPFTSVALDTTEDSAIAAEISSFQLETVHEFHPIVSAILNITPDHLNRHHTMECYAWTKERISENQTKADTCVLNLEDKYLTDFAPECKADVVWFSSERKPSVGAYVDGEMIKYTDGTNDYDMLNVHDMNLLGKHNYENVCAAIAMTKAAGIPDDIIIEQVKKFKAVEHRIEYVATKNGVDYYNDSKGTNPEAAVKAIEAMVKPTILIGGGYDKGSEFDLYVKAFKDKVKLLVLIGQTSAKIADTCKKYGFDNIEYADSMEQVVDICAKNAVSGDAVLLSPACASWGMFDNYEQRGRIFKDLVNNL